MTRRAILRGLGGSLAACGGLVAQWRFLSGKGPGEQDREVEVVGPVLDVLLPDGTVRGHHATGSLEGVLQDFRADARTHRALLDGVGLLDEMAHQHGGASFLALGSGVRPEIVEELSRSAPGTTGWLFFGYLRERAMLRHYASPATWAALGFHRPPQPKGHYDYREPPHPRS